MSKKVIFAGLGFTGIICFLCIVCIGLMAFFFSQLEPVETEVTDNLESRQEEPIDINFNGTFIEGTNIIGTIVIRKEISEDDHRKYLQLADDIFKSIKLDESKTF